MRIVYVTDSYPPLINGVSYVVSNLAESMASLGHQIEVVTIDTTLKLPKESNENGVFVRRIFGLRPQGYYHIPSPEIIREIKKKADFIHAHNFHSTLPYLCALLKTSESQETGKLIVSPHYHTHGIHFSTKLAWVLYDNLLRRVINRFDTFHCVSEFEARLVENDFGVTTVVVGNGIREDVYNYKADLYDNHKILRILCIGTLEPYKRFDMALVAASIARKKRPDLDIELNLVGSGPASAFLNQLASNLKLRMFMHKRLPRKELLSLYCKSNCLVNCSKYEAFSIVTAEALAIGIPVVIVRPWGVNFSNYPRAAIVDPLPEAVAEGIIKSTELKNLPYKRVPTWSQITQEMCSKIYTQ